jgi:hypothetical protein
VIISPSLPSIGTILNNGTWASPMKPTHRYDTKAYHDYYIHQAGKGYPVFAGRRYQRGHGLGSIFEGLFKAAMSLLKKGAKTLEREALKTVRCLVCPMSGLFSFGRSFYNSLSWGSYRVHSFLE